MLHRVRSDIRILANAALRGIEQLSGIIIAVDLYNKAVLRNAASLRACVRHLAAGGLLIVFPAGRISRFNVRSGTVEDTLWTPAVARLIRAAAKRIPKLPIVPAYVGARNSVSFHVANAIHSSLGLALLPRQLMRAQGSEVTVRFPSPLALDQLGRGSDKDFIEYLRWRTYLLANRCDFKACTRRPLAVCDRQNTSEPIAAARPVELQRAEIDSLPSDRKLGGHGELHTYIALASEVPNVVREIGRLREHAFRAVGEGTGRDSDLDRFDDHYWQLFLWNEARGEIAGAYRLMQTDVVLRRYGIKGLYTATLFDFGEDLLQRMGPALELGRSFVRLEYQRDFAPLVLLWKAIGRFLAEHPRYRVLFGAVSISNAYSSLSRDVMVSYLEQHASLDYRTDLVSSKIPFRKTHTTPDLSRLELSVQDLSDLVVDVEGDARGVPVLLRHYLKLGGRLLGFNLDPAFSNALDGLIVVDLLQTERKLLDRYFGKTETANFLAFHSTNGPHQTRRVVADVRESTCRLRPPSLPQRLPCPEVPAPTYERRAALAKHKGIATD